MRRERRRVTEAVLVAATLSAAPSTLHAVLRRGVTSAPAYLYDATCAAGTLVPPFRPGFGRGAVVHLAISASCGEALSRTLPHRHAVAWGAAGGLLIGIVNVGMIGRRFPAIHALAPMPQLADNVAFGALFALVVDRRRGCQRVRGRGHSANTVPPR